MSEEKTDTDMDFEPAVSADSVAESQEDAPPPPPEPSAGPRTFPQQYTLLFGCVVVLVASLSVWEREAVFGRDIRGSDMISGCFLLAFALHSVIVQILGLIQGRLKLMATFMTGFLALYVGVGAFMRTGSRSAFRSLEQIREAAPDGSSYQQTYYDYLGQYGPGVWLALFGGLVLIWVFLKPFILPSGKKKEPAPAPARGGRRRR